MKNKLYTATGILILIISGSIFAALKVFLPQLYNAQEEYIENRLNLADIERRANLKNVFSKELEDLGDEKEILQNSLLGSSQALEFIEIMEEAAIQTNNVYGIRNVQEIRDTRGKLTAMNFNIVIDGGFSNLLAFMQELKLLPYLLNFTQITINSTPEGALSTTTTVRVYIK